MYFREPMKKLMVFKKNNNMYSYFPHIFLILFLYIDRNIHTKHTSSRYRALQEVANNVVGYIYYM